jgi:glycosyltransferase involved in cell wall biosynthesis
MKIWHPDTTCLSGGPKTFMKYFDIYFKDELVNTPDEADIIFGLNNWVPIDILKNRKCKYVHRANGVYRPILLGYPDWQKRNESMKPHYLEADHVIFQSVYSRKGYFEYLGKTEEFSIIYNGVDVEEYKPEMVGGYALKEICILGKELTEKEKDVKKKIIDYHQEKEKWMSLFGIEEFNSRKEFLELFNCTVCAVDPDPQASCNNLTLELMALGIPVVCLAEGGNPELCLPELISSEDDIINKIQYVLDNQEFFSKRARAHVVSKFNIKDCMEKYRKVFEEVLE